MKKTIFYIFSVCAVLFAISTAVYINQAPEYNNAANAFDNNNSIAKKTYFISEKEIKVPVLLYHEFYESEPPKELYGIVSTPDKFEKDMLHILKEGYTFISLDQLMDYKNGLKGIPEKSVVLTFDDGYRSNYTMIYPILKKYHIPAAIFIIEDKIGEKRYFDWDTAKELNDLGLVSIYTHGHSHVDMTKLDITEFRNKTAANLKLMEEKIGEYKYIVYSYPLGFYNDATNQVLKELGVELFMTTNSGVNTKEQLMNGELSRDYVAYNFDESKLDELLTGK